MLRLILPVKPVLFKKIRIGVLQGICVSITCSIYVIERSRFVIKYLQNKRSIDVILNCIKLGLDISPLMEINNSSWLRQRKNK